MLSILPKKCFTAIVTVLIYLLGTTSLLLAQRGYGRGRVNGTVMDDRGNPLDGVLIVLENTQGLQFKSDTDNDGVFSILGLGTGVWSLTASKEGYSSFSLQLEVRQLRRNSPVQIVLKKLSGFKGLFADKEAMELFRSDSVFRCGTGRSPSFRSVTRDDSPLSVGTSAGAFGGVAGSAVTCGSASPAGAGRGSAGSAAGCARSCG